MRVDPRAGQPADPSMIVNVPRLITAYYTERPDPGVPAQRGAFGTSGHRGSAFSQSFNEAHILAITQAICEYRRQQSIGGRLFPCQGYSRFVGACVCDRLGSAGGRNDGAHWA
jgi:phosphoglucomutase